MKMMWRRLIEDNMMRDLPALRDFTGVYKICSTNSRSFNVRFHMRMFGPKKEQTLTTTEKVLELLQPVRYKPTSVDEMAEETKFSRSEVKFLYRAFKQECPNGIIDEDTFKEVYENIFPLGDASKYAHLVFKCIDKEDTGWLPQYLFNPGIQNFVGRCTL